MKEVIVRKIKDHQAVVGIVGLGYVGLPLMLRFTAVSVATMNPTWSRRELCNSFATQVS